MHIFAQSPKKVTVEVLSVHDGIIQYLMYICIYIYIWVSRVSYIPMYIQHKSMLLCFPMSPLALLNPLPFKTSADAVFTPTHPRTLPIFLSELLCGYSAKTDLSLFTLVSSLYLELGKIFQMNSLFLCLIQRRD